MTDARIQEAEQTGHAEFAAFYARTAHILHGYLCRLCRDSDIADEILQETYFRMLNVPAMGDLPRKAYLYKTATNLLRDRWRKLKREQKLWEISDFNEHFHQKFILPLDMASVFDHLSAQERAILWLAHVEEMSHQEIGAILGIKAKSVRVMVFRAKEKAKEMLQNAGFRGSHE